MFILQFLFVGWISYTSAGYLGLGEKCARENPEDCISQHCVPECESSGSTWRCIEPKSFFFHLNIDLERCVTSHVAQILRNKVSKAVSDLGSSCSNHAECVTGYCCPICDKKDTKNRCIEPRFSFNRFNRHVPTCISEKASFDHLKLLETTNDKKTVRSHKININTVASANGNYPKVDINDGSKVPSLKGIDKAKSNVNVDHTHNANVDHLPFDDVPVETSFKINMRKKLRGHDFHHDSKQLDQREKINLQETLMPSQEDCQEKSSKKSSCKKSSKKSSKKRVFIGNFDHEKETSITRKMNSEKSEFAKNWQ